MFSKPNTKPITTAILTFLVTLLSFSCGSAKNKTLEYTLIYPVKTISKNRALTDQEMQTWIHKDIIDDTIPGISLDKA